jgi:hypothetical protein
VGLAVYGGYRLWVQDWVYHWGATAAELARAWPGDEYVLQPRGPLTTRAVTIRATPEEIWPWVAQIGANKGGWYSYAWLERLIACPVVNADRIHAEWQAVKPGDEVRMCPGEFGPPAYTVIAVEAGRALIIGHPATTAEEKALGDWVDSWAFVLEPVSATETRLISRTRTAVDFAWLHWIEAGQFVMERGMMLGIRGRAEGEF